MAARICRMRNAAVLWVSGETLRTTRALQAYRCTCRKNSLTSPYGMAKIQGPLIYTRGFKLKKKSEVSITEIWTAMRCLSIIRISKVYKLTSLFPQKLVDFGYGRPGPLEFGLLWLSRSKGH